jgi:DNA repair protein RecO (recombination protein O)
MAIGSIRRYTSKGIVLNTLKYGEKGLIVQLLTASHGRQSYMVQGLGGRSRNAKLALFQPMFALEFEGIESSKMQMHRFGEVHSGIVLQSTPFDVKKSTIALFMAEVLHRLIKESEANSMLFDFVWGSIEALDAATEGVANFHLWFLSHLCRFLGFSPGNEHEPQAWFNIAEGVFTHEQPRPEHCMTQENALILRDMLECDVRYLSEVGLNRHQRVDFLEALIRYYGYHLDTIHSVQSIRILQEVF